MWDAFYFSRINGPTLSVPYYWQQEPKAHSGLGPVLHEVVSKSEKLLTLGKTMTLPSNLKDKKYQASFVQLLIYSRAPWASKSTHPRKFGTHVTVHRTNNRPSAKKNGRRVLLSINNLEVQSRQLRTKRNYFFRIG